MHTTQHNTTSRKRSVFHASLALWVASATVALGSATTLATPQELAKAKEVLKADKALMREAFASLKERHGAEWRCQWDQETGLVDLMSGGKAIVAGDPVQASQAFIASNRALFGLSRASDTVSYVRTRAMHQGTAVNYQQHYKGVPVWNTSVIVRVDDAGAITLVSSGTWPVGDIGITPRISADAARRAVAASHGRKILEDIQAPELVILPRGEGVLAWKLLDRVGPLKEPWRHLVDATSGELLERTDLRIGQQAQELSPRKKRVRMPAEPDQMASFMPAPSPCDKEWVAVGNSLVESLLTPACNYHVSIVAGTASIGAGEEDTQAQLIHGAGITLLPGIEYTITVKAAMASWDSYNIGSGHFDNFFVMINPNYFYWAPSSPMVNLAETPTLGDCSCSDSFDPDSDIGPGPVWVFGGSDHGDSSLCEGYVEKTFTYIQEDHAYDKVYLSLGLDTRRPDNMRPSWGRFEVSITADTRFFDPNPIMTTGDTSITDQNDSNAAVPFPVSDRYYSATDEILPRLTFPFDPEAPFTLEGDYCKIVEKAAPTTLEARSHDGMFPYLRGCDGFEGVNAYLHITQFQLYLQSLGYTGAKAVNARQIEVDPHFDTVDNSYYVMDPPGMGYIGLGDGGVDDAEDADVIIHEYAHACFDNIRPGAFTGYAGYDSDGDGVPDTNEPSAINEACADFFASYYFKFANVASGFNPAVFAEWDAQSATGLRRLDLDYKYPAGLNGGNPNPNGSNPTGHTDSRIFSRALWDMSDMFEKFPGDPDRSISYVIGAVHNLTGNNTTFVDMAKRMLEVQVDGGDELDKEIIQGVFLDRGIFRDLHVVAENPAGTSIAAQIAADTSDLNGIDSGMAPYSLVYGFNQTLELTAPMNVGGRELLGWKLNGGPLVPVGGNGGVVEITLNQQAIPANGDGYIARAVYRFISDINKDGKVDGADLGLLLGQFNTAGPEADLNGDGVVDGGDLGILLVQWTD